MTPLPEQLEPADSSSFQQALHQWDEAPVRDQQADRVHEYELSAMRHSEGTQHLASSKPAAAPYNQAVTCTHYPQQHARIASMDQPVFHTPEGSPQPSNESEPCSSLDHKLPNQDAALDEAFPTIRKITPVGSPEKETLHGGDSSANSLQADQAHGLSSSQVLLSLAYLDLLTLTGQCDTAGWGAEAAGAKLFVASKLQCVGADYMHAHGKIMPLS